MPQCPVDLTSLSPWGWATAPPLPPVHAATGCLLSSALGPPSLPQNLLFVLVAEGVAAWLALCGPVPSRNVAVSHLWGHRWEWSVDGGGLETGRWSRRT